MESKDLLIGWMRGCEEARRREKPWKAPNFLYTGVKNDGLLLMDMLRATQLWGKGSIKGLILDMRDLRCLLGIQGGGTGVWSSKEHLGVEICIWASFSLKNS